MSSCKFSPQLLDKNFPSPLLINWRGERWSKIVFATIDGDYFWHFYESEQAMASTSSIRVSHERLFLLRSLAVRVENLDGRKKIFELAEPSKTTANEKK
jgi:hypothetical protein